MDPYSACSFDELHFANGLWEHIFDQFKGHLKEMPLGKRIAAEIDSRSVFVDDPCWIF